MRGERQLKLIRLIVLLVDGWATYAQLAKECPYSLKNVYRMISYLEEGGILLDRDVIEDKSGQLQLHRVRINRDWLKRRKWEKLFNA